MKVGTIIYTLGLYTIVAVPAFVVTAKTVDLDIPDTFAMIASGTIPEENIDSEMLEKRMLTADEYLYISETEQELQTISPASGDDEKDDLIKKILETDARNQRDFDALFKK